MKLHGITTKTVKNLQIKMKIYVQLDQRNNLMCLLLFESQDLNSVKDERLQPKVYASYTEQAIFLNKNCKF